MKLEEGSITILVSDESTTIEIRDNKACTNFCRVTLTAKQLSQALSRLSNTKAEKIEVFNLDRLGKVHESKRFEFEIPKEYRSSQHSEILYDLCVKALKGLDMEEWLPDKYFSSQDSFFSKNDRIYLVIKIGLQIGEISL